MGDGLYAFFLDVLVSQPMRILRADFYIKAIFILEHVQIRVLSDVVRNPTNLQHQLPVLLIPADLPTVVISTVWLAL